MVVRVVCGKGTITMASRSGARRGNDTTCRQGCHPRKGATLDGHVEQFSTTTTTQCVSLIVFHQQWW
eukprot:scaffold272802_cov51-Attheya_sp.AAC.2